MTSIAYCDSLLIRDISSLKSDILQKFREADEVALDFPEEAAADFTAVQLIEAARRYAAANAKSFALARPAAGPLRMLLDQGGFLEDATAEDRAFWLHEEAL